MLINPRPRAKSLETTKMQENLTRKPFTTRQLLSVVVGSSEDHQWYPTTPEIIQTIKQDIEEADRFNKDPTVLDCGAGDGRVLEALTKNDKYAIEKSRPLLDSLNRNIFVVGTEFKESTLIDKKVGVVFSNPPYSEYVAWSTKIIMEANAGCIYLVIPKRWSENDQIKEAIKARDAETEVLGEFDFLSADRQARAQVNIVKIMLGFRGHRSIGHAKVDPFKLWFENSFKINANKSSVSDYARSEEKRNKAKSEIKQGLVSGSDLIQVLYKLYQDEMAELIETYKKLETIDSTLLEEMDVNLEALCKAMQKKVEGLKDRYWRETFNNLDKITDKLTTRSRQRLFDILTKNTHIDFTPSNARAIVIWVLKNSNFYFSDQLIDAVETMVEKSNISLYKSNQKTWGDDAWRYCKKPEDLEHYFLEYRIVLHRSGGIACSEWSHQNPDWGLEKRATDYLNDLRTVASNLGFDTQHYGAIKDYTWSSGRKNEIFCKNLRTGKEVVLFEAKAFKNGNIHLRMSSDFMKRLNVEFGRLKGWLKEPKQAADELNISIEEAQTSFKANLQLKQSDLPMLSHAA